jgi:hypothetical protein
MVGGKAIAVEAPQPAGEEQIAQRVAAIRAKAAEIAPQPGATADPGAGREQLADWKKWKND